MESVELYARLFLDLTPNVALVCAEEADDEGDLYTGPNAEDTPVIAEAAAFAVSSRLAWSNLALRLRYTLSAASSRVAHTLGTARRHIST